MLLLFLPLLIFFSVAALYPCKSVFCEKFAIVIFFFSQFVGFGFGIGSFYDIVLFTAV